MKFEAIFVSKITGQRLQLSSQNFQNRWAMHLGGGSTLQWCTQ